MSGTASSRQCFLRRTSCGRWLPLIVPAAYVLTAQSRRVAGYSNELAALVRSKAPLDEITPRLGRSERVVEAKYVDQLLPAFGSLPQSRRDEAAAKASGAVTVGLYLPQDVVCLVFADAEQRVTGYMCFPN